MILSSRVANDPEPAFAEWPLKQREPFASCPLSAPGGRGEGQGEVRPQQISDSSVRPANCDAR